MIPTPPGPELAHEIATLAQREGLVLFVGAGINGTAGLMWKDLVEHVVKRSLACSMSPPPSRKKIEAAYASIKKEHDLYARATVAAELLGPHRFSSVIRNAIYRKLQKDFCLADLNQACAKTATAPDDRLPEDVRSDGAFGYLAAIARLCTRPEIQAVVSYNYDMLLELAIDRVVRATSWPKDRRRMPVSIARQIKITAERSLSRSSRLNVYHVHGCLPPPGALMRVAANPVVLTQPDYARSMQDPYAWEDSTQLHCLRNFTCLFLGLSMSDWNMLRLLHSALSATSRSTPGLRHGPRHFCVGATDTADQAVVTSRLLGTLGVSFHGVVGRTPKGYKRVRAFADQLYVKLKPSP